MHLYHVSFEEIESFTPRIPKWRCEGEDHTIDRICFSDEMSRCLASIPEAGNIMHAMRSMGYDPTLYVYTLDTSLLPEEAIWDYRKVSEYVPDAMGTHEYWVFVPLKHLPRESYSVYSEKYTCLDGKYNLEYAKYKKNPDAENNVDRFLSGLQVDDKFREKIRKLMAIEKYCFPKFAAWYTMGELDFLFEEWERRYDT